MPAVAINSGQPIGDQQGEVGVAAFNGGSGFQFLINSASNIELVIAITFSVNVSSIVLVYGSSIAGAPLTLVTGPITGTNCGWTYIYHITAPTPNAGGVGFFATWTGSATYRYAAMAYNNAVGGVVNPNHATGSSATASVTITTRSVGDAAFATFQNIHTNGFGAAGGSATQITVNTDGILNSATDYILGTGASSQVMSNALTSDNWVAVGVDIANIAAAGVLWGPELVSQSIMKRHSISRHLAAALAGQAWQPTQPSDLQRPPLGGYDFTSPPLAARERRRVAALVATGEFRSPTKPSDLLPPSLGGYEFASPPLVTQSRARVGAQVATGLSMPPSQASDLRSPVYGGVELTTPPTVRHKPPPDLPVPVPRWDTDAAPPPVVTWVPDPPLPPGRPAARAIAALAGASLAPSQPSDLAPPVYGEELTSPPLLRVRLKPDLPVALSRQDTDLPPQYGYDLFPQPPTRRPGPNIGATLAGAWLSPSQPSDLSSPVYGYEPTSPPVLTRWRPRLPTDQATLPPQAVPLWTPWGWPVWADLRVRPKPDLPVALLRQDADPPPQYGYELTTPPPIQRPRPNIGAIFAALSFAPSQPSDLARPVYGGWELATPPLVRARLRPDLPIPSPRWDTDQAPTYGGWELITPPTLRHGPRPPAADIVSLVFPPIVPPPPTIVWCPDPILFIGRAMGARAGAILAGAALTPSQASDLGVPVYGYDLFPPLPLRHPRPSLGADGISLIYPLIAPPPPAIVWCPDPILFAGRAIGARLAALAGVSFVPSQTADLRSPVYGYDLTSPPPLRRPLGNKAVIFATGLSLSPSQISDLGTPIYGYEMTAPPLLTRLRSSIGAIFRSVFWSPLHTFVAPPPPFSIEASLSQLIDAQTSFYFSGGFGSAVNKAAFAVRVETGADLPLYITSQTLTAPLLASPERRRDLPPDVRPPQWDVAVAGAFLFDFSQTIPEDDFIVVAMMTVSAKSIVLSQFVSFVTVSPVSGIHRQAAWCPMNANADTYNCVMVSASGRTRASTITVAGGYGMFAIGLQPRSITGDGQFYLVI